MPDLLKQFRDRYPSATLTSELLMLHEAQFVVKVVVETQEGGTATGLAADIRIEIAEDRARHRALKGLGLGLPEDRLTVLSAEASSAPPPPTLILSKSEDDIGLPESISSPPDSGLPTPLLSVSAPANSDPANSQQSNPAGNSPCASKHSPDPELTPVTADVAPQEETAGLQQPAAKSASRPSKSQKSNSQSGSPKASAHAPPSKSVGFEAPLPADKNAGEELLPAPVNLSDVIAQTDVELRRLGWSVVEGREYLTKTYDKRSRHDLTDEELLTFLLYLESLPTPPSD